MDANLTSRPTNDLPPALPESRPMNYDPDIRWAVQRVRLHYAIWDAHASFEVEVKGNCKGFSILEYAVERHFEMLLEQSPECPSITLVEPNGDTLICEEDGEVDGEEWLKGLCIGAEIISIVEAPV